MAGVVVTCFSFLFGSLIVLLLSSYLTFRLWRRRSPPAGLPNFANIPILAGYTMENLPYVLYVSAG